MINSVRHLRIAIRRVSRKLTPIQTVTLGYGIYILAVFLLLSLPFMWKMEDIALVDQLFMAASAVSTTGLVTVNTPDAYNFWGQLVLLIGFQIGGLGYMTFGSFVILASKRRISKSRIEIGKSVFAMPDAFKPLAFLKRVVVFSFVIEIAGAISLFFAFQGAGVEEALWPAIFHAVSAFCTAGFSIFPNSLEDFRDNGSINAIISILSLCGAIGFIVLSDAWLAISRKGHRVTLTSKIILVATSGGLLLGTLTLYYDPSLSDLPFGERMLAAWFQSMTALTTVGFNTHSIGALSAASVMISLVLMILGASPSGTGGGLKSTSWSAGLAAAWSAVRGRRITTFFGHTIPYYRIQSAFGAFTLYLMVFAFGSFAILLLEEMEFQDLIFEVASALGTVGISRGITGDLGTTSKVLITILMFVGRVGVISLGLTALARGQSDAGEAPDEQDLVV